MLQYWLARLAPVIGGDTHFVCANRVGEERGITFVGWSCVMRMKEPALVGMLGPTEEGVLVAEMEVPCDEGETRERWTDDRQHGGGDEGGFEREGEG